MPFVRVPDATESDIQKASDIGALGIIVPIGDLGNFSGRKQGEPEYEARVKRIHDVTLAHGIRLGSPQAWKDRAGFTFFQGPGETQLIRLGAKANLGN